MPKWFKKPSEVNYIDVDKKFNSVVSEYRRILRYEDHLIIGNGTDRESLFQSFKKMLFKIYKLENEIVWEENTEFKVLLEGNTFAFRVLKFHSDEQRIDLTIYNKSNGQYFWTTYGVAMAKSGRQVFNYTEVVKVEKPLDKADPTALMIKKRFRKSASMRADKYAKIVESYLQDVEQT